MVKYLMYAIYNEDEDYWFNVDVKAWVDQFELEGDCLFPTFEMAKKYIETELEGESAKVYKVEVITTGNFEYSPMQ